jgi:hypothetical protein
MASDALLLAAPWAESRWLSIEKIAETGKIGSAGNICPGDCGRGTLMATRLMPKKSGGEKPAAKKAPPKKKAAPEKAAANGPAAPTWPEPATMESTLLPSQTSPAIWSRIVKPDRANLTPEAARAILKLDFDPEDHRRVDELSAKAQKGTLTPAERAELEEYIRVGYELAILQSKARLSLKRANQST